MVRIRDTNDLRLVVKVARLYHHEGSTQAVIAKQLKISRPKVSRLLSEAARRNILRVIVSEPEGVHATLESRVEQRFGLKEAVLVETDAGSAARRTVGVAGARYLQRSLGPSDVLGISWGSTLAAVVDALSFETKPGVEVVQMIGGLGAPQAETHASDLARKTAQATGGALSLLPAPGLVSSPSTRKALEADPQIAQALARVARVTTAVVGVGALTTASQLLSSTGMRPEELEPLERAEAVGDIALRFFDVKGNPVVSPLDGCIIGVDFEQLRNVDTVVGVAAGPEKVGPLLGAVRAGLLDVLVTDVRTAESMLAEDEA